MTQQKILSVDTFRFFRNLRRNNSKVWMDENRERYKQHIVDPFHRLLDALTPTANKLYPEFSISGRTGDNFSRINRDIRFAKTPYYTHMYLFLLCAKTNGRAGGQVYVGISASAATVGFRIYHQDRQSAMACLCLPRAIKNLPWLAWQQKKFARKYDNYWYASEKGKWTKHPDWPRDAKQWKRARGWIVRRKLRPSAAFRPAFLRDIQRTFRDLFPLYRFACLPEWKS